MAPIEYIEGNKYFFIFHRGKIKSSEIKNEKQIIAYTVLDKIKGEITNRLINI